MSQMIYKPGGDTTVWGTTAHVLVVDEDDLDSYLNDGWLDHPSKLFAEKISLKKEVKIPK